MKKLLLILVMCLVVTITHAQSSPLLEQPHQTYGGFFDTVFDRFGTSYSISDINAQQTISKRSTNRNPDNCGYYRVFYEDGSGMESLTDPAHAARRTVLCRVLEDLSNFMPSPLSANGERVNIVIRNWSAPTTTALAAATPYFTAPRINNSGGGIVDNEAYKTIKSGVNSYSQIVSPYSNVNTSNNFYHGMMMFNFNNHTWHTNLNTFSSGGNYDLYTVILHEMMHVLGFATLIDPNGNSRLSDGVVAGFNYFSRYDTFLTTNNNIYLLTRPTCGLYNNTFSQTCSILTPNCSTPCGITNVSTNFTNCASSIKFRLSSTLSIPVYTPSCFEMASSLSHFEETCLSPPQPNDSYFLMSNAIGTGVNKRFLKPEERTAICNIGYQTTASYGNNSLALNSFYNYGASCSGITAYGLNDGINANGNFTYVGEATTLNPIVINSSTNSAIRILANDSAARFSCLQSITDPNAVFSATNGTNTTHVTFSSNVQGMHLLRYIPTDNLGTQLGNITYIFVFIHTINNCATPNVCNLVMNGNFEQFSTLPSDYGQLHNACGWFHFGSSEYYHRNGTQQAIRVPCNWAGNQNDFTGNAYAGGFIRANEPNGQTYSESIGTELSQPLAPNSRYLLTFDLSLSEKYSQIPVRFQAYFKNDFIIPPFFQEFPVTDFNMLFTSDDFITSYDDNHWTTVSFIVNTGNVAGQKFLYLGGLHQTESISQPQAPVNPNCSGTASGNTIFSAYYFIDNVSLIPLGNDIGSFILPQTICDNAQPINLQTFITSLPPTGTFSSTSNGLNGTTFSPSAAGLGTHTITYTYTNSNGCAVSIPSNITVITGGDCINNDCPSSLTFNNQQTVQTIVHRASGQITTNTNYDVISGSNITLLAGNRVTISPNSIIRSGSTFRARIEACPQPDEAPSKRSLNEDNMVFDASIVPNPNNGLFDLVFTSKLEHDVVMQLFDINGRLILNQSVSKDNIFNNNYKIDIQNYQQGIYLLKVNSGEFNKTIKVIKK